jgi:SAM-dependent methyltransferase
MGEAVTSYRESHISSGKGAWYDDVHAGKVDSIIWDHFVKDWLASAFGDAVARGARRYLDFACGTGRVLKFGSRYFDEVMGIDISPDMLDVARERVPQARLLCVDVTRSADNQIGNFDCVSLFRFLLNAEPSLRGEVLTWLARHMPSGATLIGNNHMETWSIPGAITLASRKIFGRRRNYLSRSEVERMLADADFRVESWRGYRVLPTLMGKPLFGRAGQLAAERATSALGLGRFGAEQVFVARRL